MAKTGQNFRCGFYDLPAAYRLQAIRDVGFDDTMLWWGDEYEDTDGSRYALYDTAVKIGLGIVTAHFPSTHADYLWYGDERAEAYVKQFAEACRDLGERGIRNLVLHLTRKLITPPPNRTGVENFKRMLEAAEDNNVTIALENTRFLDYNDYILQRVKSPNIGYCFDSGHANCYTPNQDPLAKYGDNLVATHIHDNLGPASATVTWHPDQHHLIGEGNVDFDKVFEKLKKYNAERCNLESYCNESSAYYGKLDIYEYLQLSYERLTDLMKRHGLAE
ncbi:MAG: sugar phosphate isomerase/epimerase [Corallococcus sp.]|nr:sugar phosphate isomerase/epimerase [Corallococcus sp.]